MEEFLTLIFGNATISIRISSVTLSTCTRRKMIHYLTFGILATTTTARILAFVSYTGFVRRTIRVNDAFWSTSFVWITKVLRQTLARSYTILLSAISVWTAGIRNARCGLFIDWWLLNGTLSEWISNVSGQANTHGSVANNATLGILCTRVRTRILAFIVDASKVTSALSIRDTFGTTIWCSSNITL